MEPTFTLEVGTRSLANLPNFRQARLLEGGQPLLYRSGYVERLSAEGVRQLSRERGIRCIVDLRGARELRRTLPGSHVSTEYRQLLLSKDGAVTELADSSATSAASESPTVASDRRRYTIDFLGRNFFTRMFLKLPASGMLSIGWSLIASLYTGDRGYEAKAAEIVLAPRGLNGQVCDFIDFCQAELAQVLRLMTHRENLPCLVHCFLGKDRTGLVVMLMQWLLGLPRAVIEEEYQLSQTMIEEVRHEAVRYYAEKNLPPSFAECSVEELCTSMRYIETKYGGVESYLLTIGLTQQEIDQLKSNFGPASNEIAANAANTDAKDKS